MISYPKPGVLRLTDVPLLRSPESAECGEFVAKLFHLSSVRSVAIDGAAGGAEVLFNPRYTAEQFAAAVGKQLIAYQDQAFPREAAIELRADHRGRVALYRYGSLISNWKVVSDLPGRIRVRNARLLRRKQLCAEIERSLMTVLGINSFRVSSLSGSVLVTYDPQLIGKELIVEFLEETLRNAEAHPSPDRNRYDLMLCTAGVGLAALAQFVAPALLIPAAALFVYCSIPSFAGAYRTLFKERRLGVDVLDAIVVGLCLASGQIFAGAVMAWCLGLGRQLLAKAQEDSRRRLVNVFGKQARTAYLWLDGVEELVSLDRVQPGDVIAVHTGESIPVDGTICEGDALVDQHVLTGESVPVEKGVGSEVFASTMVLGGRLLIRVERAGKETTTAKISAILNDSAAFRLSSQSKGEELADKAVIPTLALAAFGYSTIGLLGATAVANCDFGTGIRMAAPLALLSSLSVCANRGILIKDGRALEQMASVDTILFDKTGTLTQDRPKVHKVHRFGTLAPDRILAYCAAAEQRLNHPIAAAIADEFALLDEPMPAVDQSTYKIGYGIEVEAGGHRVLVGSTRFMTLSGVPVPVQSAKRAGRAHDLGHSLVFVAVDGAVEGAIELAPTLRPGVKELIADLRRRGIRHVAIISGDHATPTKMLARDLGMDRYFAEVLPEDKARYVAMLQAEGRKVCFVGDGINDSIALKQANVSVSLRGAATVATDTAQVVFMEESLAKLSDLLDISRKLDRNVKVSWQLILVPNLLCIGGAFFFGFGVMASVLANNVASIAALANGLRPLRMLSSKPKRHRPAQHHRPAALDSGADDVETYFPPSKLTRVTTGIFIAAGVVGVIMPVVPGWPFLIVAVALMARSNPRAMVADRWFAKRFPSLRRGALRFGMRFHGALENGISASNGSRGRALVPVAAEKPT
jgi:Cu2+-exporting ATPase